MNSRLCLTVCTLVGLLTVHGATCADELSSNQRTLVLSAAQTDHLTLEPILVTVQSKGKDADLPAGLDQGSLKFQITPEVKLRKGAKPLPLESRIERAGQRQYDLLEWYEFPAEGKFKIQAVANDGGAQVNSVAVTIAIRRPGKEDAEWGPVDRLHHIPWSNYVTDAFGGDTLDVVKRWPDSKLARHCHYYNGLFSQQKKEYDKAIASFKVVAGKYPDFAQADAANYGIAECLMAQGQRDEALNHAAALQVAIRQRSPKADNRVPLDALLEKLQVKSKGNR